MVYPRKHGPRILDEVCRGARLRFLIRREFRRPDESIWSGLASVSGDDGRWRAARVEMVVQPDAADMVHGPRPELALSGGSERDVETLRLCGGNAARNRTLQSEGTCTDSVVCRER